ncbi:uncharacterized protein LOC105201778 isoform X2 [Solenopsis invicta]|uniref:uncharacterized protein LOC105201778 isoform X2 n=1 Tax=Solenopsis invicta TaxID=13686 RepID=UPI000595FD87|nr:uncharacterized protein LOC105201778 isoform X2 [Solenopsis invicta]XP_039311602.1 uncharacterized protein LOC105201778 isoform X2 [Solenopsis invicta]XP_039311603.1 uncharacterized protein LOC105201778 isoform X2 [Solenopsis invicta]
MCIALECLHVSWLEAAIEEKRTRLSPCCFKIDDNVTDNEFLNSVKNIRIKPLICIRFSNTDHTSHKKDPFVDELPRHCEVITLRDYKTYMQHSYFNAIRRQIYVFLPEIPYVKIKTFVLPNNVHKTAEYSEIISTINNYKASMPNEETSTCLMLFCNYLYIAKRWASAICKRKENKNLSVFGVKYNKIKLIHINNWYGRKYPWHFCRKVEESLSCIAVLIIGLMQTYSIVLETECNTEEQIEARLQLFKNEVKLKRHSIGFMFCGNINEKTTLQSKIFEKLFPKVLLTDNVIHDGIYRRPTSVDELNEKRNNEEEDFAFCYKTNTMFLLLTYD